MYPSILRWTFGVLFAEHTFCLPSLSLLCFLFLFRFVWDFAVVVVVDDDGVGEFQNDSIVG